MARPRRPQRLRLARGKKADFCGPVVLGPGDEEFVCGKCFAVVVQGIDPSDCDGALLRCPNCGSLNHTA